MKYTGITLLFCAATLCTAAQERLDEYIRQGLDNNQVLKQRIISADQAVLALKNAKSYFLPSASLLADYTSAQGGRMITVPMGPAGKNISEQLLPNNFYDVRVHITYPVFNTDIYYNQKASRQEVARQQFEADAFRQELIKDIKEAYYGYCAASNAVRIYENALALVVLNVKENQSLLDNGRGLPANLLRSQSEREDVEARIIEGNNQRVNVRNWLNFLINRPLTDSVLVDVLRLPDSLATVSGADPDVGNRSELRSIDEGIGIAETMLKMDRNYATPKLNAYLDGGSQESNFRVNSGSRYYLVGAQLSVPLFAGGRNRNTIRLATLNLESRRLQKGYLTNQLLTAARAAQNNLASAVATWHASEKRLESATAYFKLVDRGFREGVNTLIEFIDARQQLTTASLQLNISQYTILSQLAEYEWQTASSKIK